MEESIKVLEIVSKQGEPKLHYIYPRTKSNIDRHIREKLMSLVEILNVYGDVLTKKEIKILKGYERNSTT